MTTFESHHLTEGRSWPMGATVDGNAVNFVVFSRHATAIDLCLFDTPGQREIACLRLPGRTGDLFHGRLEGASQGLVYGFRAHGPWSPEEGHKFNPHKLLLDPYAREVIGHFEWRPEQFGTHGEDNAPHALKARVLVDDVNHRPAYPQTAYDDTVLYETHVKGFSALHPRVPAVLRGTYAGLAHDASIAHFKRLGVTAVSLLPVHFHVDEQRLAAMGLRNYWGYNTLAFFCADPRYASGATHPTVSEEFRAMVDTLHLHDIEVILDVVYNHTAESDEHGPTLSFRGLDNASYYRLRGDDRNAYENHAGCGNTLDLREPRVLQLVMDSLRYWVQVMGVDGFRFDLAPVLARGDHGFDPRAAFLSALAQDPALAGVKLIAEPWDIGPGGYRLGEFPAGWVEWNDRFRDAMRGFWLSGHVSRGEFALRLCGSADVFEPAGRAPGASVNYVVAHDGFTLRDCVSYLQRHNEANGENNRDGTSHNASVNCGVEGPSDDPAVNATRASLQRVMLATLLLSQGTPMLCSGDELGHTQGGNNNPYCQDNETTWLDWSSADESLINFTARVIALRKRLGPFAARWHHADDVAWFDDTGASMQRGAWNDIHQRTLACLVQRTRHAHKPALLLFNAHAESRPFVLPAAPAGLDWRITLDTGRADGAPAVESVAGKCDVCGHSLVLLIASSAST